MWFLGVLSTFTLLGTHQRSPFLANFTFQAETLHFLKYPPHTHTFSLPLGLIDSVVLIAANSGTRLCA